MGEITQKEILVTRKRIEKMLSGKEKKRTNDHQQSLIKNDRFLITINVLGSAGPLRFVVNNGDKVSGVIEACLKLYAKGGRLPVLGSNSNDFLLYPSNAGSEALNPAESIGLCGGRNFVLCKKQSQPQMTEARSEMVSQKRGGSIWKTWLNKSFKILSH